MNMSLIRRSLTILLLPIAVFFFMIGWASYWIGEQQSRNSVKAKQSKFSAQKEEKTEECVEIGIIEDLMEKTLKTR